MATKRMVARKKASMGNPVSGVVPRAASDAQVARAVVRCPGLAEVTLSIDSTSAMRWSHAVHNRRRWSDARGMQQAALAASMFPELVEVLIPALRAEAKPHLEVSIPFESEDLGWQARIFPWEYVLSAVARANNVAHKLTVTRHLALSQQPPVAKNGVVLYVESAPCGLRGAYDFAREHELVARAFAGRSVGKKPKFHVLKDPSRAELEKTVRALRPEVVHITGFDAQGSVDELRALGIPEPLRAGWNGRDGMLLQENGAPAWLDAESLAAALTAAAQAPRVVSFNLHHSAARVAALTVARGVENAVAFLDEFEDDVSERFFANFYPGLDASPLYSFAHSLDVLRRSPGRLRGTSVVLWSSRPTTLKLAASAERARTEYFPESADLLKQIRVEVQPVSFLNYALLHNHRDLFERFELYKDGEGTLRCLDVEVSLETGGPLATYRAMCDLSEPSTSLKEHIRIPLTAPLARAARESVRTALYVSITARGQTLYKRTHRVTLLPVDEWRDNKQDGMWLPSFVLPRDPAVANLIAAAQRYLMAISDDPEARFDGYQSIDRSAADPYAAVHAQVRALWSTILYDCALEYVNPPPTYTVSSQRLRTPSDVVAARHGTCIDLSLFVSACLEYIDVFPAIILLRGHAFPAYWRSDADYTAFAMGEPPDDPQAAVGAPSSEHVTRTPGAVQRVGWYVDASRYKEVLHYVQSGQLVPLESVWLTQRKSFSEALEAGYTNLRSASEFDSLIDIRQAREHGVTPLPVRGES